VSAFFDILTGYFLINLSSSSSKEYAMGITLKIVTGENIVNFKNPRQLCFTTSKECSCQISQKSAEFWYPINCFVWLNDARSFLQFSFSGINKTWQFIFFLKSTLIVLTFPMIYSLPCFPLKWRAYEFFPRGHGRTPAKVWSNLNWNLPKCGDEK